MTYTVDATDRAVGRVASEVAMKLRGKDTVSFERHKLPNVQVTIVNASKARITEKKKGEKEYTRYTGYPGGLRKEKMAKTIEKKGFQEVFRKAVYGMLPDNKLRAVAMKRLTIKE